MATSAEAAHTWNGSYSGNINNKSNYDDYTYSGYYNTDNLKAGSDGTGGKNTKLYLSENLKGSFKFAGDSTARYRALCF